jgi:glycosyltransferase involved in cell wall biosynthesis
MSYVPNGFKSASLNGSLTRDDRAFLPDTTLPEQAVPRARQKIAHHKIPQASDSDCPIIVHCHLCWDWVWQRPQQFVSRLSRRHKILFVETIGPDAQLLTPFARFRTDEQFPNVTLLRLQFPAWRWGESDFIDCERRRLVKEFLGGPAAGQFENPVQWFYDPMAATAFAGHMGEIATVYDCMDELSKFSEAPPEIIGREAGLLAMADVVFTGGRKLYEVKRHSNRNCHFYGCGVDVEHFGKARAPQTEVPADIATLPRPVLGYFGVVDERMDYALIAKLADANAGGSVVMIGPALKVDKVPLPRRPNLHWLGKRAYADLPAYAKAFDVCLMPFALNAATEFINPTKALEYMATGRPIVSSAVPDVIRNFGSIVKVARDDDEFIASGHSAIEQQDAAAIESGLRMAAENSWESIVARLEDHLEAALRKKRTARQMHE